MDTNTVLENEPQKPLVAAKATKRNDVVVGVQRVIAARWKKVYSLVRRAGLWTAVVIYDLVALFFVAFGALHSSGVPGQRMVQGAGVVFLVTTLLLLVVFFRKKIQALRRRAGLWLSVFVLGLVAFVLLGVGLLLQSTVLQTVGGLFAGTALTLAITILTSQVAVKQQNAKDANIERKNKSYIPVFNELKSIQDRWESAACKREPYPRYVQGVGHESPDPMGRPLNYPIFTSWLGFKEGPEKSDFTERAARLLDKVQEAGAEYNQAVNNAKEPVRLLLDPHVKAALFNERNDPTFKEWEAASKQNPSATWLFPLHYWYEHLQRSTEPPESANQIAWTWVWAYNSIGWVIIGDIEGASSQIRLGHLNTTGLQDAPDATWFKAVLEKAWTDIDALPEIHQARTAAQELSREVDEAKSYVDKGLRHIQKMYEGGEPPI